MRIIFEKKYLALKDPEGTELLNNHSPLFISLKCLQQVEKLKYCDILVQIESKEKELGLLFSWKGLL